MKRILVNLTIVALLFSCNHIKPDTGGGTKGGQEKREDPLLVDKYICSKHQVNRYYKLKDISIKEEALKKDANGNYTMDIEFVTDEFYGYRYPENKVNDFLKCAEKFGDMNSKMRFLEPIDEGFALSAFIKEIEISSLEAFDATHPAGSSLADIIEVQYLTIYPSICRNYNPKGLEGLLVSKADETSPFYGVQGIKKSIDKLSKEERAMIFLDPPGRILLYSEDSKHRTLLYHLCFKKDPSYPIQTITITLKTDEGVYTTSKKVAFL